MATPSEEWRLSDYSGFFELFDSARRIVVLTGAGVSTLSGIPDFRSSKGLYSSKFHHMSVEEILDIDFFNRQPDIFYNWAKGNWYILEEHEPNIIHRTLRRMEDVGKLSEGIFTQNIDNLHQKAGSKKVYELHGSLAKGYCPNCHSYHSYNEISRAVNSDRLPICSQCGNVIKPDIVFYGEGLDVTTLKRAEFAFQNADLALVLGSSLVVNPAASLPFIAARSKKHIVIVNRDRTYIDEYADYRFENLEEFFINLSGHIESVFKV